MPVTLHPSTGQFCRHCPAWLGSLGLEPTPDLFVEHLVEVFREVRRVLRDDAIAWINLGDSYAASGMGGNPAESPHRKQATNAGSLIAGRKPPSGLKPKDLIGIPWLVAFALRADGWYLRQEIIWHKPNPMPESVADRCTKAHEQIFLLSKRPRYYFDADAIREEPTTKPTADPDTYAQMLADTSEKWYARVNGHQGEDGCKLGNKSAKYSHPDGRNKRSVWTVPTYAFPQSHFATFPPALIEPCIIAGCPEGGTVLDPFSGAGTTGLVAAKHGRKYVGIELNPAYLEMSRKRIEQAVNAEPLFAEQRERERQGVFFGSNE